MRSRQQLSQHPSFARIRELGGAYYARFLDAGYREWHCQLSGHTPYLLQKALYDADGVRCFFINTWVYDLSVSEHKSPLGFQPEIDYNTHGSDSAAGRPIFRVTLWPDDMTPEDIETFCWRVYRAMEAQPCGD